VGGGVGVGDSAIALGIVSFAWKELKITGEENHRVAIAQIHLLLLFLRNCLLFSRLSCQLFIASYLDNDIAVDDKSFSY